MIIKEGFSWLHANGEWVEYFEVESLAKRLNIEYSIVWNLVQNGARSDEQLPKQLTGKVTPKPKKTEKKDGIFSMPKMTIKVKKHFAPSNGTSSTTRDDYLKKLEAEQERWASDWNDSNKEIMWGFIDGK